MTRYVALLGSINVGGNRLSMAELREALLREDFDDVETVVASGNVMFTHEERPTGGLAEKIAYVVSDRFDIETFATVLTHDDLQAALDACPFADDGDEKLVHVGFLDGALDEAAFAALERDQAGRGPERLAAAGDIVYIDFADGVAASRLTKPFIERRLGRQITMRNLRSVRRIIEKMA
ncbi:MAG: DUF1697 domain-containing protein [Novosphingobium sp.]|nr:DUF1697 domain-containing protein [Novosphingobium sp.]